MSRRRPLLALLPVLAACGGEDYPKDPQKVALTYVKSNDASKCKYLTQGVTEQLTGKRGASAREACRKNVERFPAPKKVTIREYEVEPDDAEVELLADGKEAAVKLRKIDGRWRIAGFSE
ncbi:MAG TPA: hypothetical protein VF533_25095 [Solirubrobacteraceae bacterium]|jgi:hypothetical protein